MRPPAPPNRVLIVKPSALGDVVTAVPVLRGLRRTFPAARIDWLVNAELAPVIAADADIDGILPFERRRLARAWRSAGAARALAGLARRLHDAAYDWVIDLQGLLRSALLSACTAAPVRAGFADAREGAAGLYTHRVRTRSAHTVDRNVELARTLGVDARGEDMTLSVPPAGRDFAAHALAAHGLAPDGYVACVPPTRWASKRWPVRHWRALIERLIERHPVILLGTPGDVELCGAIAEGFDERVANLAGQTDLPAFVAMIAASGGVICCDSAAKFIAPAVGVEAVSLIGPTRIERTGPYLRGRAVVADVPCRGCLRRRCRHTTCMELIDPARVARVAEETFAPRTAPCRTA